MKIVVSLVAVVALVAGAIFFLKTTAVKKSNVSGIYKYTYEHNTAELQEDHYIKLDDESGKLSGVYYGTSDDFDESREGYLPGFFRALMTDLKIEADQIEFKVQLDPEDVWVNPVTPMNESVADNVKWQVSVPQAERSYAGVIAKDRITLQLSSSDSRVYVKQ